MTFMLKQIFNLIKLLNSDTGEKQLAAGIACGFVLGMAPLFSLQTVLIFICLFFFRIQFSMALLSAFFFELIAYILDPAFHVIGSSILSLESLRGLFTALYNMPIIPFSKFYNSVVMGSGVVSILLAPFVYLLGKMLIVRYRKTIVERFQQTKFWKYVKATTFYKWYAKYEELYG